MLIPQYSAIPQGNEAAAHDGLTMQVHLPWEMCFALAVLIHLLRKALPF